MKRTIYKIMYAMVAMILATACDDKNDINYEPGKPTANGSMAVYFDDSNPTEFIFQPGEATEVEIGVSRLNGTETAAEVPLVVTADEGLSVPATASFAAGESTATIKVTFGNLEESKKYNLKLTVPEEYADHYTTKPGATAYSGYIMVAAWESISDNVKMKWTTKGVTSEFTTSLQQLGDTNRFRFPNFLNSGVDYIFTIGSNSTAFSGYNSITTYANYEPYEGTEAKGAYLFDDATQSYPTWTVADGTIEVADICILEDYGTTTGYSCISIYKRSGYVYLYWTDYTDGSTDYYNAVSFSWE